MRGWCANKSLVDGTAWWSMTFPFCPPSPQFEDGLPGSMGAHLLECVYVNPITECTGESSALSMRRTRVSYMKGMGAALHESWPLRPGAQQASSKELRVHVVSRACCGEADGSSPIARCCTGQDGAALHPRAIPRALHVPGSDNIPGADVAATHGTAGAGGTQNDEVLRLEQLPGGGPLRDSTPRYG